MLSWTVWFHVDTCCHCFKSPAVTLLICLWNHALCSSCYLHRALASVFATATRKTRGAATTPRSTRHINPQCGPLMPLCLHMTLITLIWKPASISVLMVRCHSHSMWFSNPPLQSHSSPWPTGLTEKAVFVLDAQRREIAQFNQSALSSFTLSPGADFLGCNSNCKRDCGAQLCCSRCSFPPAQRSYNVALIQRLIEYENKRVKLSFHSSSFGERSYQGQLNEKSVAIFQQFEKNPIQNWWSLKQKCNDEIKDVRMTV